MVNGYRFSRVLQLGQKKSTRILHLHAWGRGIVMWGQSCESGSVASRQQLAPNYNN